MKKIVISVLLSSTFQAMEQKVSPIYTLSSVDHGHVMLQRDDIEKFAPGLAILFNQAEKEERLGTVQVPHLHETTLKNFAHLFERSVDLQQQLMKKNEEIEKVANQKRKALAELSASDQQKQKLHFQMDCHINRELTASSHHVVENLKKEIENIPDIQDKIIPLLYSTSLWGMPYLESACAAVAAQKIDFNSTVVRDEIFTKEFPILAQLALLWYHSFTPTTIVDSYALLKKIVNYPDASKAHPYYPILFEAAVRKINSCAAQSLPEIIKEDPTFKNVFRDTILPPLIGSSLKQAIIERHKKNPLPQFITSVMLTGSQNGQELLPLNTDLFAIKDYKRITIADKQGNIVTSFKENFPPGVTMFDENTILSYAAGKLRREEKIIINRRNLFTGRLLSSYFFAKRRNFKEIEKVVVLNDKNLLLLSPHTLQLYNIDTKQLQLLIDDPHITTLLAIDDDHYIYAKANNVFLMGVQRNTIENKWEFPTSIIAMEKLNSHKLCITLAPDTLAIWDASNNQWDIFPAGGASPLTSYNAQLLLYPYGIFQSKEKKRILNILDLRTKEVVAQLPLFDQRPGVTMFRRRNFLAVGDHVAAIKDACDVPARRGVECNNAYLMLYFLPEVSSLSTILDEVYLSLYPSNPYKERVSEANEVLSCENKVSLEQLEQQFFPEITPVSSPATAFEDIPSDTHQELGAYLNDFFSDEQEAFAQEEPEIMTVEEYEARQAAKKARSDISQ